MLYNRIPFEWSENILPVACDITLEKVRNERSKSKFHILSENLELVIFSCSSASVLIGILYKFKDMYNLEVLLIFQAFFSSSLPLSLSFLIIKAVTLFKAPLHDLKLSRLQYIHSNKKLEIRICQYKVTKSAVPHQYLKNISFLA